MARYLNPQDSLPRLCKANSWLGARQWPHTLVSTTSEVVEGRRVTADEAASRRVQNYRLRTTDSRAPPFEADASSASPGRPAPTLPARFCARTVRRRRCFFFFPFGRRPGVGRSGWPWPERASQNGSVAGLCPPPTSRRPTLRPSRPGVLRRRRRGLPGGWFVGLPPPDTLGLNGVRDRPSTVDVGVIHCFCQPRCCSPLRRLHL